MPVTHERHALIAHRESGTLDTVTIAELANRLAAGWFHVCTEPEDCPPMLTEAEQEARYLQPVRITLRHRCGNRGAPKPDCPQLNDEPQKFLPAEDWQAEDVRLLNAYASNVLGCSQFLRWDIQTRLDRRKRVPQQTTIEIIDGTLTCHAKHVLVVTCDGFMSASARTWLQQQATVSGLAALVPATPTPPETDSPSAKLMGVARSLREIAATLKDSDDEYSSADFDQLLVKVRTLIAKDPIRAALLDRYATQLLNEGA